MPWVVPGEGEGERHHREVVEGAGGHQGKGVGVQESQTWELLDEDGHLFHLLGKTYCPEVHLHHSLIQ